jgi:hypothetical protein
MQRLLPSDAFIGFHRLGIPRSISSVEQWALDSGLPGTTGRIDAARLSRLGFVAGERELLAGNERTVAEVQSTVEQFRTPAGASAELAYRASRGRASGSAPGSRLYPVAVPALPGAVGYRISSPGASSTTVAFAQGRYFYFMQAIAPISSLAPHGKPGAPSIQQLDRAAAALAHRAAAG